MRKLGHRPELDGVRGVAVLLVVLVHTLPFFSFIGNAWSGGAFGVDLFFVLSGFLITSLLLGEWSRRGEVSLLAFYVRRARRLLPALLALLSIFALLSLILAPRSAPGILADSVVRGAYVANFLVAYTPDGVGHGFAHLWTLAQEEQFYLLWPLFMLTMLRCRARPVHLLVVLAAGVLAVNIWRVLVVTDGASWLRVWTGPDTHADTILFGCAAGIVYTYRLFRVPRRLGVVSGLVVAAIIAFGDNSRTVELALVLPVFAAASALLLLALVDEPSWSLTRLLSTRPLRATGKVSYGLYLWHAPCLAFIGLAGLPVAVAVTLVSYRYIEQPFLRRRARSSHDAAGTATGSPPPALTPA
jgi:peptidoglycan/LPS O-acetylase OafA/YrhL